MALRDYLVKWQNVKPTLTGNDLKGRGLEPGPRFAEILRRLRAAWLDGEVQNVDEEESLLKISKLKPCAEPCESPLQDWINIL